MPNTILPSDMFFGYSELYRCYTLSVHIPFALITDDDVEGVEVRFHYYHDDLQADNTHARAYLETADGSSWELVSDAEYERRIAQVEANEGLFAAEVWATRGDGANLSLYEHTHHARYQEMVDEMLNRWQAMLKLGLFVPKTVTPRSQA